MTMGDQQDAGGSPRKRFKSPIGLGEVVGLLGVTIAALGLYVSYVQWDDHQKEKQEAWRQAQQRAQVQSALILRGLGGGSRIRLEPAHADQIIQSQTFYFPAAVRSGPVRTTGEGRIETAWFGDGLKQALHGAADGGAERDVPVAIATTFVEDGETKTDNALYQIGFTIHPRFLQPAKVQIEGLALSRRGLGGDLQSAVDATWARQAPAKPVG